VTLGGALLLIPNPTEKFMGHLNSIALIVLGSSAAAWAFRNLRRGRPGARSGWGLAPGSVGVILFVTGASCDRQEEAPREDPVVTELRAELDAERAEFDTQEQEFVRKVGELQAQLAEGEEERVAWERERLAWTEAVPKVGQEDVVEGAEFEVELRAELDAERAEFDAREQELVRKVGELQAQLAERMEERVAREREWLAWTQAVSKLAPAGVVEVPDFKAELSAEEVGTLSPDAAPLEEPRDEERLARSEEIERSLRTLLRLEWVDGITLLEAGLLSREGWTGPCVFRLINSEGRAVGSVSAERLYLEGSVTGRTLTLVLEEGYERRAGDLLPFEGAEEGERRGGERRIVLVQTDPRPWMDAMPELFREREPAPTLGGTQRTGVDLRRAVNLLLTEDAAGGRWRLEAFEGLGDSGLVGVDLVDLDPEGRKRRHLFADHMRVERREKGVVLVLNNGIQMRGGHKTPFLDGRFRIFLPQALHSAWEEAGLLALPTQVPPERAAEAGTPDPDGR